MNTIKVIDSIMGSGKTSWAIQQMNNDTKNKYIYITPFLDEVKRIKETCQSRRFYEPKNLGKGKLNSLHELLAEGKNIASTHSLFRMANPVTKELLQSDNYILILDEVMDVIEKLDLTKDDLRTIIENDKLAHMEDDFLIWDKDDYDGRYNDVKAMCENRSVVIINDKALFWNFPVEIFEMFKEVYVMTYIFDAQIQKYYYDFHGINYEYFQVNNKDNKYYLESKSKESDYTIRENLKDKINILTNDKINNIGDSHYALSSSWFKQDKNRPLFRVLKNNVGNYFNNKNKCKAKFKLWTTYLHGVSSIKGKGYTKGFIPINTRATNQYSHTNILVHCANIFLHPDIEHFFSKRNIKVNEDLYALSELLQWIWRSAIRNDENISLYIPSKRMRRLLIQWLECEI